jgi:hypothetical protein
MTEIASSAFLFIPLVGERSRSIASPIIGDCDRHEARAKEWERFFQAIKPKRLELGCWKEEQRG